jgi:hypothetical protein
MGKRFLLIRRRTIHRAPLPSPHQDALPFSVEVIDHAHHANASPIGELIVRANHRPSLADRSRYRLFAQQTITVAHAPLRDTRGQNFKKPPKQASLKAYMPLARRREYAMAFDCAHSARRALFDSCATKEKSHLAVAFFIVLGGDGGIRTHDTGISRMHP